MTFWLDAQLSPKLAKWIENEFELRCTPIRELNLLKASDEEIFDAARKTNVVVMTKDKDFKELVLRNGAPPQILWVTLGNTSTSALKASLGKLLNKAIELLNQGEPLVEIRD